MVDLNSVEDVKKEIAGEENAIHVKEVNILFLDLSSACTGYCIARLNFETKTATFKKAGVLWLDDKWSHQDKYLYIHEALVNYFWIVEGVDYIVTEAYSINPKKKIGMNVSIELHGVVKVAAAANGVKVSSFLPQSWRSELSIKPDVTRVKGQLKKDYKDPTKRKVLEYMPVPEESVSNITGNVRTTPSDLYDAVGLSMGWLKRFGIHNWSLGGVEFNTHIGVLQK